MPTPPNPTTRSTAAQLADEFARLPVTKTVLEQVELGARRKIGGLWGKCTCNRRVVRDLCLFYSRPQVAHAHLQAVAEPRRRAVSAPSRQSC